MINVRIKQLYDSDKKKQKIYDAIKKNGMMRIVEISEKSGVDVVTCRRVSMNMEEEGYLRRTKKFSPENKKSIMAYDLGKKQFEAKTIEQCIEFFKVVIRRRENDLKNGKYDDIIKSNPNLKRYCLFETKGSEYFKTGYKAKVNRGIGSTWSMFDGATGFD